MALTITRVTPQDVFLTIATTNPDRSKSWRVDRHRFGCIGAIEAHGENDTTCAIGPFRTRDGSRMAPDYAKLRSLLEKNNG